MRNLRDWELDAGGARCHVIRGALPVGIRYNHLLPGTEVYRVTGELASGFSARLGKGARYPSKGARGVSVSIAMGGLGHSLIWLREGGALCRTPFLKSPHCI